MVSAQPILSSPVSLNPGRAWLETGTLCGLEWRRGAVGEGGAGGGGGAQAFGCAIDFRVRSRPYSTSDCVKGKKCKWAEARNDGAARISEDVSTR